MIRVESTRLDATGAGANGTVATSISETAVAGYHTVAGYYYDASNKSRGFLYNVTTYTTLDGPSATQTYIWGIDGTNVVGMYTDGTGNHGFIYNGSVFTTVDNPAGDPGSTVVTGISGDTLVGTYWDPTASQKAGFMATPIPLSPNANLAALALSEGTLSPAFASNTVSYTATVPNATTSITVTPTVAQANATVTVNGTPVTSGTASGPVSLVVGLNPITVVVTAQDGVTTNGYTVAVTRLPQAPTATTLAATGVLGTAAAPAPGRRDAVALIATVDDDGEPAHLAEDHRPSVSKDPTARIPIGFAKECRRG